MTAILGISAFYHDSAAALIVDGRIVAAAQEERFTRRKNDEAMPTHAIAYCLQRAGVDSNQIDYLGFYDKPLLKFERLLETYLSYAPVGFASFTKALPIWLNAKLHVPREIGAGLGGAYRKRIVFVEHHESHAASAFFPSPFDEAAILTLDGVGEWATATFGYGRGNRLSLTHEQRFPHSLGLLYSAFTYYCGFTVNSGEYKLMGLAPYGTPRYTDLILRELIDLKDDGSFRMDMSYFNYCQGLTMTGEKFHRLFGGPPRPREALLTERHMDIAASIQKVTEEIMLRCARHAHESTGLTDLCLAGGVALNCVANGRILREGPFERIWIQPAAGDAGGALGVALFIWHQLLGHPRTPVAPDAQQASLLGPSYSAEEIRDFLATVNAHYDRVPDEQELADTIADEIRDGAAVGWFQGPMEFGPRALGSRSILADARNPGMQALLNVKIKFREGFRPFAPAVLAAHAATYFDVPEGIDSPYMLLVAGVRPEHRVRVSPEEDSASGFSKLQTIRSMIPAVTHVDYSARLQTVDARHGLFHRVLDAYYRKTGCPVLVNTSFNLGWDPIVCTPREAYTTFMSCDLDVLCMGPYVLRKRQQPAWVESSNGHADSDFLDALLACPCGSRAPLQKIGDSYRASACDHRFSIADGIPRLFWPHDTHSDTSDVTQEVRQFYEATPFPNYDDHDSVRSLLDKARRGHYARALDEAIPYNSNVLEVGCGTGQLSNFLGVACRRVVGMDLSLNSLRLAEAFREDQALHRVRFLQANVFRPPFGPGQFDVVLCNGVLHHTSDPRIGFRQLVSLVKPGGHVVIGLYNTYGRMATDIRRALFRLTGGRGTWIDPYLRSTAMSDPKRRAWFSDQYRHPHETKHTIGEVMRWFVEDGLEFVRAIPSVAAGDEEVETGGLFRSPGPGTRLRRFGVQALELFKGGHDGGFFIMIGRRPEHVNDTASYRTAESHAVMAQ